MTTNLILWVTLGLVLISFKISGYLNRTLKNLNNCSMGWKSIIENQWKMKRKHNVDGKRERLHYWLLIEINNKHVFEYMGVMLMGKKVRCAHHILCNTTTYLLSIHIIENLHVTFQCCYQSNIMSKTCLVLISFKISGY